MMQEVPYDVHLPYLFFGEEISMLARMWTRGWDLFAPPEPLVFHMWARAERPTLFKVRFQSHSKVVRRCLGMAKYAKVSSTRPHNVRGKQHAIIVISACEVMSHSVMSDPI